MAEHHEISLLLTPDVVETQCLETIKQARNASHPLAAEQAKAVSQVLKMLGMGEKPVVTVLNKIDLPEGRAKLQLLNKLLPPRFRPYCAISAVTGEGLEELKRLVGIKLEEARAAKDEDRAAAGL